MGYLKGGGAQQELALSVGLTSAKTTKLRLIKFLKSHLREGAIGWTEALVRLKNLANLH